MLPLCVSSKEIKRNEAHKQPETHLFSKIAKLAQVHVYVPIRMPGLFNSLSLCTEKTEADDNRYACTAGRQLLSRGRDLPIVCFRMGKWATRSNPLDVQLAPGDFPLSAFRLFISSNKAIRGRIKEIFRF